MKLVKTLGGFRTPFYGLTLFAFVLFSSLVLSGTKTENTVNEELTTCEEASELPVACHLNYSATVDVVTMYYTKGKKSSKSSQKLDQIAYTPSSTKQSVAMCLDRSGAGQLTITELTPTTKFNTIRKPGNKPDGYIKPKKTIITNSGIQFKDSRGRNVSEISNVSRANNNSLFQSMKSNLTASKSGSKSAPTGTKVSSSNRYVITFNTDPESGLKVKTVFDKQINKVLYAAVYDKGKRISDTTYNYAGRKSTDVVPAKVLTRTFFKSGVTGDNMVMETSKSYSNVSYSNNF